MKFQLWQPLLLLLYAIQLTDAAQAFPQTYEFLSRDYSVRFSEPEATCPDVVMRNGETFTVCYYDSEIRPKLMDCDLGEGTYQDGGAYPLLYSGTTPFKTYEFMFTFDPPLILSSFTLHYYCSLGSIFTFAHGLNTNQSSQQSIRCGTGHEMKSVTGSETPNQNVTVTFYIPPVFGEGGGIFLSEVQFFNGADSVPADPCMTDRSCCSNEAVCHVSSTAPNGYECVCPDGFSGVNCQFRSCTTLPCQNGGNCTDNLGDYCACPPAYTGKQCEVTLATKETTLAMSSTAHLAVTSSVLARQPSDRSGSSSSSATAAAAAGAGVSVFVVILIISGFVAVVVYYRRKKGKKRRKVIEHIGEDESNIYALVDKPRKKRNAPSTVPLQTDFDLMEEGLDRKETPPVGHNDPSTGQASISMPAHAITRLDSTDPQEQSPPSHSLTGPPGNTCDTDDVNSPDSKGVGQASDCEESCDQPVTDVYAVVDKKGKKVAKHHPPRPPPYADN